MDAKVFDKLLNELNANRLKVMIKKAHDYATGDVLSNFKRVGQVIKIMRIDKLPGPLCYALTLIILKLDRWINLMLSGKTPSNESVADTIMDLHNYTDLTYCLCEEKRRENEANVAEGELTPLENKNERRT